MTNSPDPQDRSSDERWAAEQAEAIRLGARAGLVDLDEAPELAAVLADPATPEGLGWSDAERDQGPERLITDPKGHGE